MYNTRPSNTRRAHACRFTTQIKFLEDKACALEEQFRKKLNSQERAFQTALTNQEEEFLCEKRNLERQLEKVEQRICDAEEAKQLEQSFRSFTKKIKVTMCVRACVCACVRVYLLLLLFTSDSFHVFHLQQASANCSPNTTAASCSPGCGSGGKTGRSKSGIGGISGGISSGGGMDHYMDFYTPAHAGFDNDKLETSSLDDFKPTRGRRRFVAVASCIQSLLG